MPCIMSEKPFDHYLLFDVLDFVMDEDFQDWTRQPTPDRDAYWQAFTVAFPQKAQAVETARRILQQVEVGDWQTVSPHQLHERYHAVLTRLDTPTGRVIRWHQRGWTRAAAGVLLGLLSWGTYQYGWAETAYQTTYGQQQRVLLTDQTAITLAANSRLRVPGRWQFSNQREVWLTGEAYFEVAKRTAPATNQPRNFVVHTRDLNVEVLGTRFNVNTYRGKTIVLLDEGKIRLSMVGKPQRPLLLRPGQTAVAGNQSTIQVKPTTDPTLTAWRDGRLVFRDAALTDLGQRVREVYGLTLVFDGDGWAETEFTGELPAHDVALATQILAETFGAETITEDDRLILRKPNH